ncbi:Solute carrier family 23 member 1 like protein [Argiope bruennichi]|uniref:Solute carrier family 23 member 1 like protein n=1 Tax=Argiope bruennichi TaxID=94029 RepID=A0A8T0F958_ARGBR|nr:Solute carrier family 23 member 1 like protein [Argiope bruennichi]
MLGHYKNDNLLFPEIQKGFKNAQGNKWSFLAECVKMPLSSAGIQAEDVNTGYGPYGGQCKDSILVVCFGQHYPAAVGENTVSDIGSISPSKMSVRNSAHEEVDASENKADVTIHTIEGLSKDIDYKIDDIPPWYVSLILSFQHYLMMLGGTVSYPYLISSHLCIPNDDATRGYLISTTLFVSGIGTLLQTTVGTRLPIVQGSSMAFLVPLLTILHLPEWKCPEKNSNMSLTPDQTAEIWMPRMREVQGAIIGASVFEMLIGMTGMIGLLLNWITPLAIVPTISLVTLPLFAEAAHSASGHWGIAALTIGLMILFSQGLRDFTIPYFKYSSKKGWTTGRFPLFKLFPILLTLILSWSLCGIFTAANIFQEGNPARTDTLLSVLDNSPWIRLPYPGQFGLPTFSVAAVLGAIAGSFASIIESVGDYYACARLSGAEAPPKHAINRGIFVEGLCCMIAGFFGTACGLTSFSENIGAIGITKVASRRVIQYGGLVMVLFGMFGKFGGIFVTIPQPILGGLFCIMFSMVTAIGLSSLHFIDLNSSRNLFVLGFSLFMGLCIPSWIQSNPGAIQTGNKIVDQIITILLRTNMLVGGFIGFLLDNIIPGTDEERGLLKWKKQARNGSISLKSYELPYIKKFLERRSFFRHLPISPSYEEGSMKIKFLSIKSLRKNKTTNSIEMS